MTTSADVVAIQQLYALYGHRCDDRDWVGVAALFTEELVYDSSEFGMGVMRGRGELITSLAQGVNHPLAHQITDPFVFDESEDTARGWSKVAGLLADGLIGTAYYEDHLARTAAGWRVKARVLRLRRERAVPPTAARDQAQES